MTSFKRIQLSFFTLVVFFLLTVNLSSLAQTETFMVDDFSPQITNQEWAADSSAFVFLNLDVDPYTWVKINIGTREITESQSYPLSPNLSIEEKQIFQTNDVIRLSPNGTLLLYATMGTTTIDLVEGDSRNFWYTLAHRNTQQIVVTSISAANEENIGDFTAIQWSNDSSSVAIRALTQGGTTDISYVNIPNQNDFQNIFSVTFDIEINGQRIYTADPFINRLLDISDNGEYVLLTAQKDDIDLGSYEEPTVFVLWNPLTPQTTQIIEIPIDPALTRAAFAPESQDELFVLKVDKYAANTTLYRYDLINDELYELISVDPMYNPLFSPNGEWLSYNNSNSQVFLKISELLPGILIPTLISTISVTEFDSSTTIAESGATDHYTLTLGTQPTTDVVLSVAGTDQVTVSPTTLTFTPTNWDTPQTVTVSAVDDSVIEGAHTAVITHSAVSADAGYDGILVAGVTVNITDNDSE